MKTYLQKSIKKTYSLFLFHVKCQFIGNIMRPKHVAKHLFQQLRRQHKNGNAQFNARGLEKKAFSFASNKEPLHLYTLSAHHYL